MRENYITTHNMAGEVVGLRCSKCLNGPDDARRVRDCWHPGCISHCTFFDESCLKGGTHENPQVTPTDSPRAAHYYKEVSWSPGRCVTCGGSGHGTSAEQKVCEQCHGNGLCPTCHGYFYRPARSDR